MDKAGAPLEGAGERGGAAEVEAPAEGAAGGDGALGEGIEEGGL